jgi:hypothetical protein
MTRTTPRLLALALAAALIALAPRARADGEPVTIEVRATEAVDAEALRRSLERDLGLRVEIVRPDQEGEARIIVDIAPDGLVRMRVRRDDRPPLERETEPTEDRARTTVTVSLLLSNLVRDESSEVLALLRIAPPPPAPAEPPVVIVGPEPAPPAPSPEVAPPPAPTEELVSPFAIDFVPLLGFSTAFVGRDRRMVSLGVVGGLSGALDGVGLSSVLDLSLGRVAGVQGAGVSSRSRRASSTGCSSRASRRSPRRASRAASSPASPASAGARSTACSSRASRRSRDRSRGCRARA